jgi:hypothetical protein
VLLEGSVWQALPSSLSYLEQNMPKFRLLQGTHVTGANSREFKVYEAIRGKNIVESEKDLVKEFGSKRFAKVHEDEVEDEIEEVVAEKDEFDALTDDELMGIANRHGIDIKRAKTREKLLAAIRGAMAVA